MYHANPKNEKQKEKVLEPEKKKRNVKTRPHHSFALK